MHVIMIYGLFAREFRQGLEGPTADSTGNLHGCIPAKDFIETVLTGVDGEKDPRNLMLSFDLIRFLIHYYGFHTAMGPFLEDAFESLTNYFPIDFTPPKDDKYKITAADLKGRLNNALLASPAIAPLTIPFVLERLTT